MHRGQPAQVGPWRILQMLGEGAHGVVYEAEHEHNPGQRVALKVLHRHRCSVEVREQFFREARAASRAAHSGIVQVCDAGATDQGQCYLVMERVNGRPLNTLSLPVEPKRCLALLHQVARVMAVVHARGVVHRDLKPQNVMIVASTGENCEEVRILDFGVAKLVAQAQELPQTASGAWIGTPAYMSREQWLTQPDIDGRADIYALGIMGYELLLGHLPFQERTAYDWQQAHLQQPVPQGPAFRSLPRKLQRLLLSMMAKHRDQRPTNMLQVATAIAQIQLTLRQPSSYARPVRSFTASGQSILKGAARTVACGIGILVLQLLPCDQVPPEDWRNPLRQPKQAAPAGTLSLPSALPLWGTWNERGVASLQEAEVPTAEVRSAVPRPARIGTNSVENLPRIAASGTRSSAVSPQLAGNAAMMTSPPELQHEPALESRLNTWQEPHLGVLGHRFGNSPEPMTHFGNSRSVAPPPSSSSFSPRTPSLLLQWKISPPSSLASIRIAVGDRTLTTTGEPRTGSSAGWVPYTQDRWPLGTAPLPDQPTQYAVEVRDEFGCWVGAGTALVDQPSLAADIYVPIDAPNERDHTLLELEREVVGRDTTGDGQAVIEDEAGQRLIDCGQRCRCVVPKTEKLVLTGQGSERHPFVAWANPNCQGENPCNATAELLSQSAGRTLLTARYATWEGEADGFQTVQPPLVVLSPAQHRFFQAQLRERNKAEYSNPSQLRALSAPIDGSLWMAGRGGTLIRWDAGRRAFRRTQAGKIDPKFPPSEGTQSPQARLLDFFGIAEEGSHRAYAVGAEDIGSGMDPMATAFHFDGEGWKLDPFVEVGTHTRRQSELLGRRVLRGVVSSISGGPVIAVGLDGNILERGVGLLPNPDPSGYPQNLWAVAGDSRTHLIVGAEVRKSQRPILLYREGTAPFQLVNNPPTFSIRTAWASPDGTEYWLGGIGSTVVRYLRGPRSTLTQLAVPCAYGPATPPVVIGIWGTGPDNVWIAGGDRVWHCAGQGLWEVVYQAEPGMELVGLQGEIGRDLWAIGFRRSLAANPNAVIDPERTDRSLVIRLPLGGISRP